MARRQNAQASSERPDRAMERTAERAPDRGRERTPGERGGGERTSEADYLRLLGERVRETRARRGMTRKILARDSGVSERYLAQLESGQGNISIILLRQVAHAMGVPLTDLVREGPEVPIELTLLTQFLSPCHRRRPSPQRAHG